jgi:hypothetical protein
MVVTGRRAILTAVSLFSPRRDLLALAAILAVACCLLVPRLDDRYLWEDEAETALLARNVLRFGVPLAWDGRDLVSQECGADLDANGLWRQTPWLPMYLVAASFHLLGVDAFAARLPFVLVALATLPSLWYLALVLFRQRRVALVATIALALSVPFLLHARQSRYYVLVAFAVVWTLAGYVGAVRGRRAGIGWLALAMTVLFHANYLVFAATLAGLIAALPALRPARDGVVRIAAAAGLVAAFNAPWLLLFDPSGKTALAAESLSFGAFAVRLGTYLRAIELYFFPVVGLGVVLAVALVARRRRGAPLPPGLDVATALALFCAAYVCVLSLTPLLFLRYLVGLAPVGALLIGYVVTALARTPVGVAAALALILGVDRADALRFAAGSPLIKYVDEITHDYEGPIEAVVRFLDRETRRGDRVYVTYGALGVRFHTDLEVRGGTACQPLDDWRPEWLVVRWFFRLNPLGPTGLVDAERVRQWANARILSGEYRRIELPAIDSVHDALPEPDLHLYRTPREGRRVAVWKRVGPRPTP